MSVADQQFKKLLSIVEEGKKAQEPRERTEAEEDQIALELFILEHEGPAGLENYQRLKANKSLKLNELPPAERAIIERERVNQRDFTKPALGRVYAPRPTEDQEPNVDCIGRNREPYRDCPSERCKK
ncbi:MAG: hypothetical protein SA339_13130 [Methanomassiliicoccus sp.]|nr:hypothetical protein [Methanomassiliicoccus sp.]